MIALSKYINENFFNNVNINPYKDWLDNINLYKKAMDYGCHEKHDRSKYHLHMFSWNIVRVDDNFLKLTGIHFSEELLIDISKIPDILSIPIGDIHVSVRSYSNKTYDITFNTGEYEHGITFNTKLKHTLTISYDKKRDTIYNIRKNLI